MTQDALRSLPGIDALAELRESWHGVGKLLLAYDGSSLSADFLDTVLSFIDPAVAVTLIDVDESKGGQSDLEEVLRRVKGLRRRLLEQAGGQGRRVGAADAVIGAVWRDGGGASGGGPASAG